MKKTFLFLISAVLTVFIISCTKKSSVATGGTETGDAVIAMGSVTGSDGRAVSGAVVRMLLPGSLPDTDTANIPRAVTDSRGSYYFSSDNIPADYIGNILNILIRTDGEVSLIDSVVLADDSLLRIPPDTLRKGAFVRGWFDQVSDPDRKVTAFIENLAEFADVDTLKNSFTFSNLPAGIYDIYLNSSGERNYTPDTVTVNLDIGDSIHLSDTLNLLSEVLLENFNDGDNYTNIRNIVPESYWFAYNSATSGNLASVEPPELTSDFTQALTSSGSYEGVSLHYSVVFDISAEAPAVGTGFFISPADSYVDFSAFDSLSFFCKGENRMRVSIQTETVSSYPDGQDWGHFGKIIECPQEWQKIVVKPEDLIPEPGSPQEADNLQWNDVKNAVDRIVFGVNETYGMTVDVWIDDIRIYGLKKDDFE